MLAERVQTFKACANDLDRALTVGIQSFLRTAVQAMAAWGEAAPSAEADEVLTIVPPAIFNPLGSKAGKLPAPAPCQLEVKAAILQAITAWQANPEVAPNSLVVLNRPVEDVTAILKESLQTGFEDYHVQFCLKKYQRPLDPLEIPQHIKRELEPDDAPTDIDLPTIVVIPRLDQCFLRCIQGWEGIEYLQALSTRDTSRFWVFGCNHWAWAFLERVCQVGAYLEQTIRLPELEGEDLKAWLLPYFSDALTVMNLEGADDDPPVTLEAGSDRCWASLSNLSSGIGATAARLWLKSLRVRESASAAEGKTILLPAKPALPSLMTLEVMDRYLLHSLMIHEEMTTAHLALSLGEAERKIRDRLQVLKREGIIIQRGRRLAMHPAHYPKLYSELKNNNFLIGEI